MNLQISSLPGRRVTALFSVSESMIEDVKKYILNQKEHHRKISFAEEYKKFEEKYGLVTGNR